MAGTLREISLKDVVPNPIFEGVSTLLPSTQSEPPRNWDPAHLHMIPMWSDLAYDQVQVLEAGALWLDALVKGEISSRTAIQGLRLSLSLRSMNPGNTNILLKQPDRIATPADGAAAKMVLPNMENFLDTPFRTVSSTVPTTQVEVSAAPLHPPLPPNQVPDATIPATDNDTMRANSYSFLAAYLMKLLVKSGENVHNGLRNMKRRFAGFYAPSRIIAELQLTVAQILSYKDALLSQSLIISSYTIAVAHTHQSVYRSLDQKEKGVLSYLCFLPFAYTGMHAYTLMINIKNAARVPLDRLLTLFYSDITAPSLIKIAEIVKDFERTTQHPDRDITFRYCAMWAAEYFAEVRSKNCPHLTAILVSAWKVLRSSPEGGDPEQIVALNLLPAPMKLTLGRAGAIIGNCLVKSMLSGAGTSPVFTLALGADEEEADTAVPNWGEISGVDRSE